MFHVKRITGSGPSFWRSCNSAPNPNTGAKSVSCSDLPLVRTGALVGVEDILTDRLLLERRLGWLVPQYLNSLVSRGPRRAVKKPVETPVDNDVNNVTVRGGT
jgi:hypothetical protein